MPRYYVPPAPGTIPRRARPSWRWPLLLVAGGLLLGGLLLQPGHELLNAIAAGILFFLYMLLLWLPPLLGLGVLLYVVAHVDRRFRRRLSPPRPAPSWVWETWEILLCLAALLLAVLYYAAVDSSQWLRRRWRRWRLNH